MRITKFTEQESVDHSTGEVLRTTKSFSFSFKSSRFVKIFLEDVEGLGLLSGSELKMFFAVSLIMDYENVFKTGDKLWSAYGNGGSGAYRALEGLLDANIINKIKWGVYRVNPYFAGKGKDSEINELRRKYPYKPMKEKIEDVLLGVENG